jgi:GH15 family glucan-1,4-alpha-glucosidase
MKTISIFAIRILLTLVLLPSIFSVLLLATPPETKSQLEISRPVRAWEFLCSVGKQSAIFGNESGHVEGWVYPLKLFRDFSLTFHTENRSLAAESLARTITVRPESTTILYAGDTFRVKETFFAPVDQPGAIIRFDIETEQPLEIEAAFHPDFQLEWPAALGATYSSWDARLHATVFGADHKLFAGLFGSPTAALTAEQFDTNYNSSTSAGMRLGVTARGRDTKILVMAASINGAAEAEKTYKKLIDNYLQLQRESAEFYSQYLQRTLTAELPDQLLQQAYDWSRVSVLQGMVTNPYLGTGLIAGYRTSGESQRPGFAWYFGRDAEWTTLALNSEGDFSSTKDALNFLIRVQQENGRIPHEIAQTATLVNWFKDYPYGTASADATPLFLIAVEDYVRTSGDISFAKDHWSSLSKAYEFLRSTYDENGLPKNFGVGHGWVEGGPLLPVRSELYQSGVGAEAIRALSELAKWSGKDAEAKTLTDDFVKQRAKVDDAFWSSQQNIYSFALSQGNKQVVEPTVLATVPMWFNVLDPARSKQTISRLAALEHATDWGMRIISNHSANYSAGGYHFGSVWPLFTGWASVAEYNYHQGHPALQNLRANALLALDGSPGHVTEVLSGDYYQGLSTGSPHQIWSAAMVVSPMLKGLFGLKSDAIAHTITLAPSLPANWSSFALQNIRAGNCTANATFHRSPTEMVLEVYSAEDNPCTLLFQPALSLRAEVMGVELNGHAVPFQMKPNDSDQHLITQFRISHGINTLHIRYRNDFAVSYAAKLPALGHQSEGLRILSETWNPSRNQLTLELEGLPGVAYDLSLFNGKELANVGGNIAKGGDSETITVTLPPASDQAQIVRHTLVLELLAKSSAKH